MNKKFYYVRQLNSKTNPAVAVIIGESTTKNGRDSAYTCKGFDKTTYGNIVDCETCTNESLWPKIYVDKMKKFKSDHEIHKILKEKYQDVVTWSGESVDCDFKTRECFHVNPGHTVEELIQIIINENNGTVSYNNFRLKKYQRKPFTDVIDLFTTRGHSEVLLEAAPRFGKSFVSLRVSVNLKKERILILTPFPDAKSSFRNVVESHEMMKDYEFVDLEKIRKNKECLKNDKIVMFLSWQSFSGDNNESILEELKPDFFIIDECHRQADTEKSKILIDKICNGNTIQKLFLSATPYDDKVNGDFKNKPKQIVTYDLVEMIDAAKDTSPKFPKMSLNFIDNCADVYNDLKKQGNKFPDEEKFTLAKMLADKNNKKYAEEFWKRFLCTEYSAMGLPLRKTLFSELNHQPKHIIIYVPDGGADINKKVFKKLVSDKNCDLYGYAVEQASAEDNAIDIKKFEKDINSFHEKNNENGTITITKGRGTTGVTINKLDCVIIAKTMNSTELFVQTFCRPITPETGKDEVSIFCFDSEARLNLTGAANVGVNTPNEEAEKRLKRFLDVVNVYHFSENGFTPEPWEEILGFIKEITVKRNNEIEVDLECLDLPEISDEMITLLKASSKDFKKTNHSKQIGNGGNAGGKTSKYTTEKIKEENSTSNLDIKKLIRSFLETLDWEIIVNQCDTAEDLMKLRLHHIDEINTLILQIIQSNETKIDNICYKYRHTDKDTLLKVLSPLSKTDKIEPPEVINLIFDKAADIFKTCDIHAKFFDPCCGRGFYLNEMINRLMQNKNFIKQFPDDNARRIYIKENNIIGNDIEKKFCYILQQEGFKNVTNYDIFSEKFKGVYEKMKFDKIIMNPPYDGNLHLKILEKVIEINPDAEIVCLHPARWLIDPLWKYKRYSDHDKFKNTIVDKMTDYINFGYSANELLGMGLDGHLCISMYNTKKKDIKIYNRDIEGLIDRIIAKSPNNIANNIELDKIDGWRCITKVMLPLQGGNTDRSKLAFVNLFQCVEHNIFYNGYEGDKYWTEVRKASGGVNKARYESGQPLSHSIKFKTEQEALNYEASMKTNFIHNWIHLIKLDQNVPLKFIPYMEDYTHIWTDEMYCKYFGLNEEESKYMSRKVDDYRIKDFIKYETI